MDAKVLENIKRATLRVKSILDESEALLRELKSRRARTPELALEQELAPSNEVSDIETDGLEGHQQVEEQQVEEEQLEEEQLEEEQEQAKPELEGLGEGLQEDNLNESNDTDSTQEAENDTYVSSDDEDVPLYRPSNWSCCCRRN